MVKNCLNCNKEFEAKNTTYKSDFCSAECAREHSKIQVKQRLKDVIHNDKHKTNLCAVCGKEFSNGIKRANHTLNYHCLDAKEYYDLCFKANNQEGKCLYCSKETRFAGLPTGYRKYCSREHEKLYLKENFNVTNIAQRPDIAKKIKNNNLEKYGVENVFAAKEFADKIRAGGCRSILKDIPYTEIIEDGKIHFEVQREDGTYILVYSTIQALAQRNTRILHEYGVRSTFELEFMRALEELGIEFEYEHSDDFYPYACDFYLPKYKAYIELHTGPQHGQCAYDENIHKDVELNCEEWNRIWKIRDVEKRKCAEKNNLNYVTLYTPEDIENYLEKLNENK